MVDNRFEIHVEQTKFARAAEAARMEEQRELEAQAAIERETELRKVALLNQEREMRHLGNSPEEVWGPSIATMMFEFLDYARSASQGVSRLIGSEPIWDQGHVRTRGYPIAYTNVKPVVKETSVPEEGFPYRYKKLDLELLPITPPRPDVLLCVDGMIRTLNDKHIPLADATGRVVKVPGFVQWTETQYYYCVSTTDYDYPGDSTVPTITGHTYHHVADFQPSIMDSDSGLEYVLNDYANQIYAFAQQPQQQIERQIEVVQYPVRSRVIEQNAR